MISLLFDNSNAVTEHKISYLYTNPVAHIICYSSDDLKNAFAQIKKHQLLKHHLAGYLGYELGHHLNCHPMEPKQNYKFPLINLYVFRERKTLSPAEVSTWLAGSTSPHADPLITYNETSIAKSDYLRQIEQAIRHIHLGNTYQINFTAKQKFNIDGCPVALYKTLRKMQHVNYAALLQLDDHQVISLSPELFFKKTGNQLHCKPMKGTMPRSADPEQDRANLYHLQNDPKMIAENMIIVDLMRNDLSRISQPGSVQAPKLLEVETYQTLHQMTSTITSTLKPNTDFASIVRALFPCGSITGAPKKRTMEIISELEDEPRNIYTGAIGFITPDNDMTFSVAIRTLLLQGNEGEMGIGGGIVSDSDPQAEYEEMLLKSKFFTDILPSYHLLETMRCEPSTGYSNLETHLQRLRASATELSFNYDESTIRNALVQNIKTLPPNQPSKIRLILQADGTFNIENHEIADNPTKQPLRTRLIRYLTIDSDNKLLHHKTTESQIRQHYNKVRLSHPDCFDVIFINQDNIVTEAGIANVFIRHNGKLITSPVSAGLLPGITRQKLLDSGAAHVQPITTDMLLQAEKIYLTNAIIGTQEAILC